MASLNKMHSSHPKPGRLGQGRRVVLDSETLLSWSVALLLGSGVSMAVLYIPPGVVLCVSALILSLALGILGLVLRVRQRGLLTLVPEAIQNMVLHDTLLMWLTDVTILRALQPYAIFLLGLTHDETELALQEMPVHVQTTLLRPGLLHLFPRGWQEALLPQPPVSVEVDVGGVIAKWLGGTSATPQGRHTDIADEGQNLSESQMLVQRSSEVEVTLPTQQQSVSATDSLSSRLRETSEDDALVDSLSWDESSAWVQTSFLDGQDRDLRQPGSPVRVEGFLVGSSSAGNGVSPLGEMEDRLRRPRPLEPNRSRTLGIEESTHVSSIFVKILQSKMQRSVQAGQEFLRSFLASQLLSERNGNALWSLDRPAVMAASLAVGGGLGALCGIGAARTTRSRAVQTRFLLYVVGSAAGAYWLESMRKRLLASIQDADGTAQEVPVGQANASAGGQLSRFGDAWASRARFMVKLLALILALGFVRSRLGR